MIQSVMKSPRRFDEAETISSSFPWCKTTKDRFTVCMCAGKEGSMYWRVADSWAPTECVIRQLYGEGRKTKLFTNVSNSFSILVFLERIMEAFGLSRKTLNVRCSGVEISFFNGATAAKKFPKLCSSVAKSENPKSKRHWFARHPHSFTHSFILGVKDKRNISTNDGVFPPNGTIKPNHCGACIPFVFMVWLLKSDYFDSSMLFLSTQPGGHPMVRPPKMWICKW